jgi:photosystem II stability/assembly factor-like uncharacterized protein
MVEKTRMKKPQRAIAPPDDPLLRHEELNADIKFGSEGKSLTELRLAALKHARAMPTSAGDSEGVPPLPAGSNWVQLGPMAIPKGQTYSDCEIRVLVTGRITGIVVDPTDSNTIYVGAAQGGIWKTIDRGKTWSPKSDNEVSLAIGALAIDPGDHLTLYAGTGEGNFALDSYYGIGILKTTNGGASWTRLGAEKFTGARFCRLIIDPTTPTTLFAATTFGVYRSMDGGMSWTQMTSGLPTISATVPAATAIIIDPTTPDTVYAAFWASGIYRTNNASAANPTWTKITSGLPASNFSRIALGIAPSTPQTLYALLADANASSINQFYRSTDGGNTWSSIPLPAAADGSPSLGGQGFYNLNVAVDPTTPDIVYLSAISLWKAMYHPATGAWTFTDIGNDIHPDNHAFAFDPADHLVIYAGSDGGIYTSSDGGMTWSDTINSGLCITQCEFMEQHPTSDAVIFLGTQDNGTEQFRNSPVFYHADDGDGGFVAIDPTTPRNVLSTYYGLRPKRSTAGGAFGSWASEASGLSGDAMFYPPLTLDQSNSSNSAIGGTKVFLDAEQGEGGWPDSVALPGLAAREFISAINYTNSDLIYVGTNKGKAYRLTKSGGTWTPTAIHAAPLPARWIWDIAPRPDDINTVIVVMSGFGTAHVWRGTVPVSGTVVWADISGTGAGRLPDIPVNALVIEPLAPDTMYIATDIAVFRTIDGGTTWTLFSDGLPNCAVFDMRLHTPARLLRVATHGRGVWERQLDALSMPDVDTFVRDNLMQTGRRPSFSSESAAFEDPLQHVELGDSVWWWQCADIKIDALEGAIPEYHIPDHYQMKVDEVDYVAFESRLEHRNPQPGRVNRVYVQIHNRGIQAAPDVTVKILYTDASAGLPDLPTDFWTAFPTDSVDASHWKPIGIAQTIALLLPTEPAVLEWGWNTPTAAEDHSCILVVTDCPSDPIPVANKVLNVGNLIANEKHVGLNSLHVVTIPPETIYWTPFQFFGDSEFRHIISIPQSRGNGWGLGLLFPRGTQKEMVLEGFVRVEPTKRELEALKKKVGADIERYDTTVLYKVGSLAEGARVAGVIIPKEGLRAMLLLAPPSRDTDAAQVSIVQETEGTIVGGSTFALRQVKL